MGTQTCVTVNSFSHPYHLLMMSDIRQGCHREPPERSPQAAVLSLTGTDTYLQRKHICPHHKQDISSGLPVRSSHSCQMPLVHIFTPNTWQVKWTPNTLLSPEGLRCALVTESLAGFKSESLPGKKKKMTAARLPSTTISNLGKAAKPQQVQWGRTVITWGTLQLHEASPKRLNV